MPLGSRVWKLGQLLLLAGALGLTFIIFFGIAMRAALKAREVQIPGVVGASVTDATRTLNDMGLALRVDDTRRPAASCSRSRRRARKRASSGRFACG